MKFKLGIIEFLRIYWTPFITIVSVFILSILFYFNKISLLDYGHWLISVFSFLIIAKKNHTSAINELKEKGATSMAKLKSVINQNFSTLVSIQYTPNEAINYMYAGNELKGTKPNALIFAFYLQKRTPKTKPEWYKSLPLDEQKLYDEYWISYGKKLANPMESIHLNWIVLPCSTSNLREFIENAYKSPKWRLNNNYTIVRTVPYIKHHTPFINFQVISDQSVMVGVPCRADALETGIAIRNPKLVKALEHFSRSYWERCVPLIEKTPNNIEIAKEKRIFNILNYLKETALTEKIYNENDVQIIKKMLVDINSGYNSGETKVDIKQLPLRKMFKEMFKSYWEIIALLLVSVSMSIIGFLMDELAILEYRISIIYIAFALISGLLAVNVLRETKNLREISENWKKMDEDERLPKPSDKIDYELLTNPYETRLTAGKMFANCKKGANVYSTYFRTSAPFEQWEGFDKLSEEKKKKLEETWNEWFGKLNDTDHWPVYHWLIYVCNKDILKSILSFFEEIYTKSKDKSEGRKTSIALETIKSGRYQIRVIEESFESINKLREIFGINVIDHPLIPLVNIELVEKSAILLSFPQTGTGIMDIGLKINHKEFVNQMEHYFMHQLWPVSRILLDGKGLRKSTLIQLAECFNMTDKVNEFLDNIKGNLPVCG